MTTNTDLINNTDWLAGYAAYERGEGCPWGNESARQGWITAKKDDATMTRVEQAR